MLKKLMHKFRVVAWVIFIAIISIPMTVSATTINEIKQQQQQTQQQLADANEEIDNLTDIRKGITDEIQQIDNELVEILTSISILEDEITDIEGQIEVKKVELAEAEETMNNQYEAMKARIKFMYEKGDYTYTQLLFEAQSMGDAINKADYIEELYAYDRQKLKEFVDARDAVELAKRNLEEEQEELTTAHYELELEKQELDNLLEQKKEEVEDYDNQIAKAKQEAALYKAQIKQQNNQIKKLEEEARKKAEAEAEAKRKAEAKKKAEAEAKKRAEEEAKKKDEETVDSDDNETSDGKTDDSEDKDTSDGKTDDADDNEASDGESDKTVDEDKQTDESDEDTSTEDDEEEEKPATPSNSSKGQEVVNYACQFIGNPYVAGGTSLTQGADCSGFTQAVYAHFGYSLPRSSTSQRSAGVGVTYAEAQPGDIICYAGHVAIYMGNGQIVHASTPATGIKTGSATYREILAVRRIIQ